MPDLGRGDDASMVPPRLFPGRVERYEVGDVERQQRSALCSSVCELVVVRDALIGSAGLLTGQRAEAATPQRMCQSWVDMLVGEESERHPRDGAERAARAADSLRVMSSLTRCGCCA